MSSFLSPNRERALLLTLMAMQFTAILDFMIMMPLSSQLMVAFTIDTGQFGMLVSSYSLAAGVSALIASAILDKFDRRQALLVSYIGLLLATLACAFANAFVLLMAARILAGFFGGVLGSIIFAIVGDLIPPDRRGRAMGIVMLAFSLASVAGVPLGLFVAAHFNWQTPFSVLAAACGIMLVVGWLVVPPIRGHMTQQSQNFWQSYNALLSVPNHWWGFITSCLIMAAGFMVIPYIAPALVANVGLSQKELPYIYLVGGAVTLITRPIIGRMTDKHRHAKVLTVITIASFVPVVLITQSLQVGLIGQLIIAALFFICVSGRFIPCSALITASCTPQFRGRVMAFNSAVQNLGAGVAALFAGAIMSTDANGQILNYEWVGYASCIAGVLALFTAWRVKAVS